MAVPSWYDRRRHPWEGAPCSASGDASSSALLGGAAAAWPLAARAQQPAKLPTIGFLGTATASAWRPWVAAFVQRLRELGWIKDRTFATSCIAGPRAEPSALSRSRPSSFGSTSMSSSRQELQFPRRSGRPRTFRLSLRFRPTPSAAAWLQAWRALAATSLVCRRRGPILSESGSDSWRTCPGSSPFGGHCQWGLPRTALGIGDAQAAARKLGLEVTVLRSAHGRNRPLHRRI